MKFKIILSRKIIFSEGLLGNICLPGMLDFQYSDINIKQILGHHDLNYFDSWAWTGRQFVNWRTWPWCWNTWLIESASTSITSMLVQHWALSWKDQRRRTDNRTQQYCRLYSFSVKYNIAAGNLGYQKQWRSFQYIDIANFHSRLLYFGWFTMIDEAY